MTSDHSPITPLKLLNSLFSKDHHTETAPTILAPDFHAHIVWFSKSATTENTFTVNLDKVVSSLKNDHPSTNTFFYDLLDMPTQENTELSFLSIPFFCNLVQKQSTFSIESRCLP